MTGPFNPGAGRAISFGEALAMGLAQGTTGFIAADNQFSQQRQQQANILADQQFRQQQAEEQRRQFEAQAKQARDTQAFQFLNGQQQQLTQILAKGGFQKGSPEYQAAEQALKETNKLMSRTIRGDVPTPEEMETYDTLIGNVGAITGQGAAGIGGRVEALENAQLGSIEAGTTSTVDANTRANELQPFTVAGAGYQNRAQAVAANVAEGTQGDMIARPGLENAGLGLANTGQGLRNEGQRIENDVAGRTADFRVNAAGAQSRLAATEADVAGQTAPFRVRSAAAGARREESAADVAEGTESAVIARAGLENELLGTQLDTSRWQLTDLKTKAPLVYDGMRLSNETAQQALDFNAEAQPERMTALRQQNEQTRQAIDQSSELFPWQKRGLTAQVNVQEAQADIVQATKAGTISRQNAESWSVLAREVRDPAAFDQLVKEGVMTPEQAEPFKRLAGYYRDSAGAALDQARASARTATVGANVAERTEDATVRGVEAQAAGAEVGVEAARFSLDSAQKLFPTQLASAQTALATANFQLQLAREKKPFDLALLKNQVTQLEQTISQNGQLFGPQLAGARLQVQRLRTEVSILEKTAPAAVRTANAEAAGAEVGVEAARFNLTRAKALFPVELKSAQIALDSAGEELAAFREGRPVNLATLKANLATVQQALSTAKNMAPAQLAQAWAQVAGLESEVRVAEQTEGAQVITANAGATNAVNNATISGANATVAVALIPSQIAAGKLVPRTAQAQLDAQLNDNRLFNATFKNKVKQMDLTTSAGVQQLLDLKLAYSQSKQKFPKELEYLDAQIAVQQASAKEAASKLVGTDGNTVTDKKAMIQSLTQMRMINSQDVRAAQANLQNTARRLMPNAKFSVDRYDPKTFTTLVASQSNLTPEQRQELQNAQLALDVAQGQSKDLSTAFGQVAGKGRIDPKVAERLGIYAPGEAEAASSFTSSIAPGTDLKKLGFTADALNNTKNADGSWTSYCTRFARQYAELATGSKPFSLGKYFKGTATETRRAFESQNAMLARNMKPADAVGQAGSLKEGDMIFLNYGNPRLDHVAVYDGKGGIIQHSLPGFRGQTVQGAVNTMSLEQFLGKAGKATVSFGRVGGVQMGPQVPADVSLPGAKPAATKGTATAPPPAAATTKPAPAAAPPAKLTPQTARPFLVEAFANQDKAALERLHAGLVAGGMKPADAEAWIRSMKPKAGKP